MNIDPNLIRQACLQVENEFVGEQNTDELKCAANELLLGQKKKFEIVNVIGRPEKFKAAINSEISNLADIEQFIITYGSQTNETLRIYKEKTLSAKSSYLHEHYYRCQHNTRNMKTRDVELILIKDPSKTLKNSNCPMSVIVRVRKDQTSPYPCTIDIKWNHNHSTSALQVLAFKDIPEHTSSTIYSLFACGMTPATAYRDFLRTVRSNAKSDMDFHQILSDRSQVPKRRDFNALYTEFNR